MAKPKEHKFKFKSKKGQDVEIVYKPVGIEVNNEKVFQGHLEKVTDLLQCTDYKAKKKEPEKPKEPEQPKIKGIDEV